MLKPFGKPPAGADCCNPETAANTAACVVSNIQYLCSHCGSAPSCSPPVFQPLSPELSQTILLSGLIKCKCQSLAECPFRFARPLLSRASFALPPFVYQSADSCRKRENPLCSGSSSPPTLSLGACVLRDSLHFLRRYRPRPRNT